MKLKTLLRQLALVGGIIGIVFLLTWVFFLALYLLDSASYASPVLSGGGKTSHASVGLPVRLTIPEIHVDAVVEHLGLTPQGAMAVPAGPADVAWYKLGPRPGEIGSAVIAGHVGWKDNIPAAFDTIASLRPGDKLYVEDSTGATITFVVRKLSMYDQNQNASNIFSSYDGKAHLNLIACEGVWNAVTKTYSKRLVVFTDKTT